ncbi:hypothetical protein S7711_10106 [Stachybotrys chartarum IBT 7711]|uniref:Ribonuclease T2-like n=1 Tax=Stachybotrys chartarum (strain CBS 109288 / IBT 7711) TaxID=1280523 RepID=A0A084B6B9_STACB|nr:hypothetical protein S7711_10106 [Stachybotrys chartarum IBT 7711]
MSSRTLLVALAVGPALAMFPPVSVSCPADLPISCQNTTAVEDTCCFNHPGGQVLLTQFWDTAPSTGPADAWTIHGLWPDNCDGTWEEYCDPDREYFNISAILTTGAPCTLAYMQDHWKDYQGDDEDFWEHEFNKHGTCMSSLEPACYPGYAPGDEVVDYFKRTVRLHRTLPSYAWLAEAGIVPSPSATYTRDQIQAVLSARHGHDVIINCNRRGELTELWYHYNIRGSVQTGEYIPVPPVGSPSTCPATGIRYLPKYATPSPTTTTRTSSTTAGPAPTYPPGILTGRGYFYVDTNATATGGFLISRGTWYRSGNSPAFYTSTPNAGGDAFALNTSRGKCEILDDGSLFCDASVAVASEFGFDGTYLTYDGSNSFFADAVPSGQTQGTVYVVPKAVEFKATWSAQ